MNPAAGSAGGAISSAATVSAALSEATSARLVSQRGRSRMDGAAAGGASAASLGLGASSSPRLAS